MEEDNKKKREEFTIKVGPLLKKILEKQVKNIKEVTYDEVNASNYEAGEIIAKKVTESNLM